MFNMEKQYPRVPEEFKRKVEQCTNLRDLMSMREEAKKEVIATPNDEREAVLDKVWYILRKEREFVWLPG